MERGWGAKLLLLCCSTQIRGENQKKGSLVGDWECKRGGGVAHQVLGESA